MEMFISPSIKFNRKKHSSRNTRKRRQKQKQPPTNIVIRLLARENIRFSSLFAAGDVLRGGGPPHETSPAAKSEEKRMFSQAIRLLTYVNRLKTVNRLHSSPV